MWDAADEVAWVTVFIPGRQLTLSDAMHLNPAEEARFAKHLVLKALASLPNGERDQVRGFGVVEPGVMEIREGGESTTTLVAMHLHLLVWRLSVKRVHDLLHKYAVKTDEVTVPLRVTAAPTPAGALAYSTKHLDDHRVSIRDGGKARFKRRPEGLELEVLKRWCGGFSNTDAEVRIGIRRHKSGLAGYG
jgi:hypothetical protein